MLTVIKGRIDIIRILTIQINTSAETHLVREQRDRDLPGQTHQEKITDMVFLQVSYFLYGSRRDLFRGTRTDHCLTHTSFQCIGHQL